MSSSPVSSRNFSYTTGFIASPAMVQCCNADRSYCDRSWVTRNRYTVGAAQNVVTRASCRCSSNRCGLNRSKS